ncbi:hypothetical protein LSTR_LSTR005275 [Laodelphax striatellus]|uniref:Uncharacterized protein n=1 Tax=Laodelphax striatellus TaxID=195883 RepID=A0A482X7W2_LAOST|nr:hypothetical protein LSTR_LSTR005275 [Laodelphax striatellus]
MLCMVSMINWSEKGGVTTHREKRDACDGLCHTVPSALDYTGWVLHHQDRAFRTSEVCFGHYAPEENEFAFRFLCPSVGCASPQPTPAHMPPASVIKNTLRLFTVLSITCVSVRCGLCYCYT